MKTERDIYAFVDDDVERVSHNPFLADSVHPVSHINPSATYTLPFSGPTEGRPLTSDDVRSVPTVFTSSPTVKNIGSDRVVFAAGVEGIRKINATDDAYDLVSFLPYPGFEHLSTKARPRTIDSVLHDADVARHSNDDAKIRALSPRLADIGFNRRNLGNGTHSFIDRDGCHYAAFGGMRIIKSSDNDHVDKPLRVVKVADFSSVLPGAIAQGAAITAMGMTYDGHVVATAYGTVFLMDRDLRLKASLMLPGEVIEHDFCIDENNGIYVVTSKRMLKVAWTGSRLSIDPSDGGWSAPYNTSTPEQVASHGGLHSSGGSGTPPTLMGLNDDEDRLVIIADADPEGSQLVAFWRDEIPEDFEQKADTQSKRIADQRRIDITKPTVEASPAVYGNGVLILNTCCPDPLPDIWGNAMTAGVTRPAPKGVEKFTWNNQTRSFQKAWIVQEIDNADATIPVISAGNSMVYLANKVDGDYQYAGLDWHTGRVRARWPFPDDSRKWNSYGAGSALLEDGDLLVGGIFATKRVHLG